MSLANQFIGIISTSSISRLKLGTILFLLSFAIYLVILKFKKSECLVFISSCSTMGSFVKVLESCLVVVKVVSIVLTFDWGEQLKPLLL
jgi:hypothetical protein